MSRYVNAANADGLFVGYGTRKADNEVPAVTAVEGQKKQMSFTLVLKDLTDTTVVPSPNSVSIPRGSLITDAYLIVTEAAVGGTSIDIGTYAFGTAGVADGTVDDADGIFSAIATGTLTLGAVVPADGALPNATAVGATSNSSVTVAGTYNTAFSAGIVQVFIEYIVPGTGTASVAV